MKLPARLLAFVIASLSCAFGGDVLADDEWLLVGSDQNAKYYLAPQSIRAERRYLRFESRVEYHNELVREIPNRDGGPAAGKRTLRIKEKISRLRVVCETRMWAESSYTLRDAKGDVTGTATSPPAQWEKAFREAAPGSALARMLDQACTANPEGRDGAGNAASEKGGEKGGESGREKGAERTPDKGVEKGAEKGAVGRKSGTGIVLGRDGHVLTNQHVVDGCTNFSVFGAGRAEFKASRVAGDPRNDLAVLKAETTFATVAKIRAGAPLQSGESLVVAGFPLSGLLASEPNVGFGYVSATSGLRDDASTFQFSAPVHRGNSGGPILDQHGRLIGVVTSKLNVIKTAAATGDIAQNISFGVKSEVIRLFLTAQSVGFTTASPGASLDNVALAAAAKDVVVQVLCR